MHRIQVTIGALVLVAVSIVVAQADAWDPLSGWFGLAALFGAGVGAVLVVGRPRGLWLVLLIAPALLLLNRAEEPDIYIFVVPVFVLVAALVAAAALGIRALVARSEHGGDGRRAGAVLLAGAVLATGYGVWLDLRVVEHIPAHPRRVDLVRASYRGVTIGMPASGLSRVLGSQGRNTGSGSDQEGDSGPSSYSADFVRAFDGFDVLLLNGRVVAVAVGDNDAETRRGVGIGDSLEIAQRRYPKLYCDGQVLGSDSSKPSYPSCDARLPNGRDVYFGGDPIDTIWLAGHGELQSTGRIRSP